MAHARNIIETLFSAEDQETLGKRLLADGFRYDVTLTWLNNRLAGVGAQCDPEDSWQVKYQALISARQKRTRNATRTDGTVSENVLRLWAQTVVWPAWQRRRKDIGDAIIGTARDASTAPLPFMEAAMDLLKQKVATLALHDTLSDEETERIRGLMDAINKRETAQYRLAQLELDRDKFQFDAASKAMEHAAKIKVIASDTSLSSRERVERVRETLFGSEAVAATVAKKAAKKKAARKQAKGGRA